MKPPVKLAVGMIGVVVLGVAVLAVEAVLAAGGPRENFQNPSQESRAFGSAPAPPGVAPLKYAVLGDSTAAGQGAEPEAGIAPSTARALASNRSVQLTNFAVSGAPTADVLKSQVAAAAALKPDVVLVSAGANDVTKLTPTSTVTRNLAGITDQLIAANCNVKIVLTGSPDMGGARRFAQPLRWVAGLRSQQLNPKVRELAEARHLTFAPIAERTGPAFRSDPALLAADRFHPNARGYALWTEVLNPSLAEALSAQPSHCT